MQVVAENSGERVDVFLARRLPELTRSAVARLLEHNAVTCNGMPVKKNAKTFEYTLKLIQVRGNLKLVNAECDTAD